LELRVKNTLQRHSGETSTWNNTNKGEENQKPPKTQTATTHAEAALIPVTFILLRNAGNNTTHWRQKIKAQPWRLPQVSQEYFAGVAGDNTCKGAKWELLRFDNTNKGEKNYLKR
jgi:hypothetical protein